MMESVTSDNSYQTRGEIEIAPEVLEVIAHIATNEVDGVYALKSSFSSDVKSLFGKTSYQNGVKLSSDEEGLKLEIYCNFNYGVNVPKVALEIQEAVREQVYHMTGILLSEVNVHVVAIVLEKEEQNSLYDFTNEKDDD